MYFLASPACDCFYYIRDDMFICQLLRRHEIASIEWDPNDNWAAIESANPKTALSLAGAGYTMA